MILTQTFREFFIIFFIFYKDWNGLFFWLQWALEFIQFGLICKDYHKEQNVYQF